MDALADVLYLDAVQFPAKCNGELVAVDHHSNRQRGKSVFSTSQFDQRRGPMSSCPVAKASEIFATRWTPLVLRTDG